MKLKDYPEEKTVVGLKLISLLGNIGYITEIGLDRDFEIEIMIEWENGNKTWCPKYQMKVEVIEE